MKLVGNTFGVIDQQTPDYIGTPAGIGGDVSGIWYCDANDNALYELLPDFTKVRKRIGPIDPVGGIGGKLT